MVAVGAHQAGQGSEWGASRRREEGVTSRGTSEDALAATLKPHLAVVTICSQEHPRGGTVPGHRVPAQRGHWESQRKEEGTKVITGKVRESLSGSEDCVSPI